MLEVIGIDPGQVHTGMVYLKLNPARREYVTRAYVFDGVPPDLIREKVDLYPQAQVYIEDYRVRGAHRETPWMIGSIALLRKELPKAKMKLNHGVVRVVTSSLLKALGLWTFDQKTNHQDLRSAARIGILAALKDEEFNRTLAQLVADMCDGNHWKEGKI